MVIFRHRPIMPGVMQVEALAQLAGIVCLQMEGATPGAVFFFAAVDGVKWKKPVIPGDVLVMEVEITKWKAKFGIAKAKGRAYVDGELAVEVDENDIRLGQNRREKYIYTYFGGGGVVVRELAKVAATSYK
jgi:3-hydroxyacyl-[acyl-carrier-protein] dehydratase